MKASWGHLCKTSWRCFENVLKTSWRSLEDIFARRLQNVLKMSWRRFENVLKTSWRRMSKTNILVLIKTSWRRLLKTKTKEVFKTSSSRRIFAGIWLIYNTQLSNISQCKGNQAMKFGKLKEYRKRNVFLQKSCEKWGREASSRSFLVFLSIILRKKMWPAV